MKPLQLPLLVCLVYIQMKTTLCDSEGEIRLAENKTSIFSTRGRLEIYHNGVWGTVCDDGFDNQDAEVVCKQLGKSYVGAYSYTAGGGLGDIWLDDVECIGSETHLTECSHNGWAKENCGHQEDVGVSCVRDGAIRLAGGSRSSDTVTGRLEIFHKNVWGTVCGNYMNNITASVVCKQLGEKSLGAVGYISINRGSGKTWLGNVVCNGTENNINACYHTGWGQQDCTHSKDIAISCFNRSEEKLRLSSSTSTSNSVYGRLEVYKFGVWGTVCNRHFNNGAAKVACRQLGKKTNNATVYVPNSGSGHIWLNNVVCKGSESSIGACAHSGWGNITCPHKNDVGISCFNGTGVEVRLSSKTRTSDSVYGRLEVKYNGIWGTVCRKKFDKVASEVVCRQLGERTSRATNFTPSYSYGKPIWLSNVVCNGSESTINDCAHSGWGLNNCTHSDDVGVSCFNDHKVELRLSSKQKTTDSVYGKLQVKYNGIWGTVCDINFNKAAAMVVCRELGERTIYATSYEAGTAKNRWLSNVECQGSESTLNECSHSGWGKQKCLNGHDVGIACFNGTEGSIQLVGKTETVNSVKGILQIYLKGMWKRVCNTHFDSKASTVTCRQLGIRTNDGTSYNAGYGKIWLQDIRCTGSEASLISCTHRRLESHSCSRTIGIICTNRTEGEIRLADDTTTVNSIGGRLEIFYDGMWGSVCDTYLNFTTAEVVCRQLGKDSQKAVSFTAGRGSGKIWLSKITCTGLEPNLTTCLHSGWENNNCTHKTDLGIGCVNGTEDEGHIRLAPQTTSSNSVKGRLEIYHIGIWGTVCKHGFSNIDAKVVCKQLGIRANEYISYIAGGRSKRIWLSNIECNGSERSLSTCGHDDWGNNECSSSYNIGVICANRTEGEIRLASKTTTPDSISGRLEIFHEGVWGTICDQSFSSTAAAVVCQQLGIRSESALSYTAGGGAGEILLSHVVCTGLETNLMDCSHLGLRKHSCSHSNDVGVVCSNGTEGDIRLADSLKTSKSIKGRLEIYHHGVWGRVCKTNFNNLAAKVVCRQLGIRADEALNYTTGGGRGKTWMNYVRCKGSESALSFCNHNNWRSGYCRSGHDVGVICINRTEGEIRLAGRSKSPDAVYGRLEIFHNKVWGSVCDNHLNSTVAKIVCGQLGIQSVHYVTYTASYGSGPIWLRNVVCKGSETNLTSCSHSGLSQQNCTHSYDVGVSCYNGTDGTEGEIRLITGRLEIYHAGIWGTVCAAGFDKHAAKVACKQLGQSSASASSYKAGYGSGQIWLSNVVCIGNETTVSVCSHSAWGQHKCSHDDDVGINCIGGTEGEIRLADSVETPDSITGRLEIYHFGVWGTLCYYSSGNNVAKVACMQLGASTVGASVYYAGGGVGQIWIKNIKCKGSETSLSSCAHRGWGNHSCQHVYDIGVTCLKGKEGLIRLAGGSTTSENIRGRLEIYHDGVWGTVSRDGFNNVNARVVCQQLGAKTNNSLWYPARSGSGKIWLDDIRCKGSETSLSDCSHRSWGDCNCNMYNRRDVGIVCSSKTTTVKTRLMYGSQTSESLKGRLEIYSKGQWAPVCSKHFDQTLAGVSCQSLGAKYDDSSIYIDGTSYNYVWLYNTNCSDPITALEDCLHLPNKSNDCPNRRVVGLACRTRKTAYVEWTWWSSWSTCSVTCGGGTVTRTRTCKLPQLTGNRSVCFGDNKEIRNCSTDKCPVDGYWSSWSSWTNCSETCGSGYKTRNRSCTNPSPTNGGNYCIGNFIDIKGCEEQTYQGKSNGSWSSWSDWNTCSVTCGSGYKKRQRSCDKSSLVSGGRNCYGDAIEIKNCQESMCSVDGEWNGWSTWENCLVTCGLGKRRRVRFCASPYMA